jgi:MFS family permease
MAQPAEVADIYTAGMVQGLALVTFPAASTVLTSPQHYGLSSTEYATLFVPQAAMAVGASLLGARLIRHFGIKRIYLIGLTANLVSMALLFLSQFAISNAAVAYGMLILATTSLGIGFGLTVPALNTFASAFFPRKIDSAVLILNALLGLGTVLAPVFVAVFIRLSIWSGLPLLVAVLLLVLLLFSLPLPLQTGTSEPEQGHKRSAALPSRFWIFAAFVLLYGVCETMNGNWASLYTQRLGATATVASLALTVFWGAVTAGRIIFAAIERWFPAYRTYRVLPFVVTVAFVALAFIPKSEISLGVITFGLAGLGCSALLPLTISFAQKELTAIAPLVPGSMIAFYQAGYGIAAFSVGPLQQHAKLSLNTLFGATAIVALAMSALSLVIAKHEKGSASGFGPRTSSNMNDDQIRRRKIS